MYSWQGHQTPVTKITYTVALVAASAFGWLGVRCMYVYLSLHVCKYVCMHVSTVCQRVDGVSCRPWFALQYLTILLVL